jgi:Rieske Fe-S protein
MVRMRISLKSKKITGAILAVLTTAIGVFACSDASQTQTLEEDQYFLEQEMLVVSLDRVPELSEIGGSVNITSEDLSHSVIIARLDENKYIVASKHCTHKGKELKYDHKDVLFKCSGGKGKFNIDGSVAGGPPEKPLKIYPYIIEDSKLIINFSDI